MLEVEKMDEENFMHETTIIDEDDDMMSEDKLDGSDPWEIAFEEGVRMAEFEESDDDWDDFD